MTDHNDKADDCDQRVKEFTALFSKHQRQLHVYIVGLVFDPADVYDILQDTNLVLWEKFDSFESGTNFLAWARKIAFHRVLRFRESKSRRMKSMDPHVLESLASASSEQTQDSIAARQAALEGCLAKLKQEDRLLVESRYKSPISIRELAQQIGRSENGISQSLRRIRNALKECITQSLSKTSAPSRA